MCLLSHPPHQGALVFVDLEVFEALNTERQQQLLPPLSPAELESKVAEELGVLNKARPDYHPYDHVAHVQVVSRRGVGSEGGGRGWEGKEGGSGG